MDEELTEAGPDPAGVCGQCSVCRSLRRVVLSDVEPSHSLVVLSLQTEQTDINLCTSELAMLRTVPIAELGWVVLC